MARAAAKKARAAFSRQLSSSPEPDKEAVTKRTQSRKRVARPRSLSGSSASRLETVPIRVPPLPTREPLLQASHSSSSSISDTGRLDTVKGPLVWVRVNIAGQLAGDEDEEESTDYFWWPGGALSGSLESGPITVLLFGRIARNAARIITVAAPSPSLVLPMKKCGRDALQFTVSTFKARTLDSTLGSPSKRPRTDLEEAFRVAVTQMHEADASLNDGLPSSLSSYKGGMGHVKHAPHVELDESVSLVSKSPEPWFPPPCDPFIEIPGEPVLAVERKNRTEYWPARIESYIPPQRPSLKPKYRLRFLDDTMANVSRDMFYISDEPEFATCKLGQFESIESDGEVDSEGDDADESDEHPETEPSMPPPESEAFCGLSIRDQFAYLKPVLHAVLNDAYPPAADRHKEFMRGGASRQRLRKSATGKGDLSAREVSRLGNILQRWVLGRQVTSGSERLSAPSDGVDWSLIPTIEYAKRNSLGSVSRSPSIHTDVTDLDLPPSSVVAASFVSSSTRSGQADETVVMRQKGCAEYEVLSGIDKVQYCFLVLLHEATLQLLLWRGGMRRSLEPVEPQEEQRLHDLGLTKSEEVDFVAQVYRLRRMKTKETLPAFKMSTDRPSKSSVPVTGSRSRNLR